MKAPVSVSVIVVAGLSIALLSANASGQVGALAASAVHHANTGGAAPHQQLLDNFLGAGMFVVQDPTTMSWVLSIPQLGTIPLEFAPSLPHGNPGVYSTVNGSLLINTSMFDKKLDVENTVLLWAVARHEWYHQDHWKYKDEYKDDACGHLPSSSHSPPAPGSKEACEIIVDELWDCHGPTGKGKGACFEASANDNTFADICEKLKHEGLTQDEKDALNKARERACSKAQKFGAKCTAANAACGGALPSPPGGAGVPPSDCKCP